LTIASKHWFFTAVMAASAAALSSADILPPAVQTHTSQQRPSTGQQRGAGLCQSPCQPMATGVACALYALRVVRVQNSGASEVEQRCSSW
jgi:hypothetical protein